MSKTKDMPVLALQQLSVRYPDGADAVLSDIDLCLHAGEIVCVIGESGCGKSTLFHAVLQQTGRVEVTKGSLLFCGRDLQKCSPGELRKIHGAGIGAIFQEPGASLDPIRKIHRQFYDVMHTHDPDIRKDEARRRAAALLRSMDFADPDRILDSCPAQLSGGMNQRVAIALAMLPAPAVLLADEPTSALDASVQAQVLNELLALRKRYGTAMLLITHSMGVVARVADRVAVMRDGRIVECGSRQKILEQPSHSCTRALLAAVPRLEVNVPAACSEKQTVLEVKHVSKAFYERGSRFAAVDDISLLVREGECVGIVGESGSGKSTLAQLITRLIRPDSGSVRLCGTELTHAGGAALRIAYRNMKMIFQEPRSAFDPRLTLGASICEALSPLISGREAREAEAKRLLRTVSLDECFFQAYPGNVSGGECQRAAIARALAQKPRLLICDEASSALDMSVQAEMIALLNRIRRETNLSILFISHDLALVSNVCERIYVLCGGKVVEEGETARILREPEQEYTRRLMQSVLSVPSRNEEAENI